MKPRYLYEMECFKVTGWNMNGENIYRALTISQTTRLLYVFEVDTTVPSRLAKFITEAQSVMNEVFHSTTAVSSLAAMQRSSSLSLITALNWTSIFILNTGAISQGEKQKIKRDDKHHWSLVFLRVFHCGKSCPYSRSSRRPSGTKSQRPLCFLTSKYVVRGMTRVTPEVSNNCPFAWQCVKLPRSGNMLYIWSKCHVGPEWVDSERKLADRSKRCTKALY